MREFSIDGKHIYGLNVEGKVIHTLNIRDAATQRDFYKIEGFEYEDQYRWEKKYSTDWEPKLSEMIKKVKERYCSLIPKGQDILDLRESKELKDLLIVQLLRSNDMREVAKKSYRNSISKIQKSIRQLGVQLSKEEKEVINKYSNLELYKEMLMEASFPESHEKIQKFLNRFSLILIYFSADCLVIGDSPLVIGHQVKEVFGDGKAGLTDFDAIILYPLTPRILALGFRWFPTLPVNYVLEGCVTNGKGYHCSLTKGKKLINLCNQSQLNRCTRFVYSNRKDILEQLKQK